MVKFGGVATTDKAKRSNNNWGHWSEQRALSGLTKDKNIGYGAEYLTTVGMDLKEVRVVGDE
jgi:hypothetical protein